MHFPQGLLDLPDERLPRLHVWGCGPAREGHCPRGLEEADEEERRDVRRGEDADLELGGVEQQHRENRHGELGDLRAELAERLPAPHGEEVAVPPQRSRTRSRTPLHLRLDRLRHVDQCESVIERSQSLPVASGA